MSATTVAYLLVQPCNRDRRPNGIVIGIDPVLTEDDAAAVTESRAESRNAGATYGAGR